MQRFFDRTTGAPPGPVAREDVYRGLGFPAGADHPSRRPYTAINMVATVDGKVVIGGPGTTPLIGSATDHYLMVKIDLQADAVLFGAGLIREDNPPYPRLTDAQRRKREAQGLRRDPLWAVVSSAAEFARRPRLFEAARENTALFTTGRVPAERRSEIESWTQVIVCGEERLDPLEMGRRLRDDLGVARMMCLGGPLLNATLIEAGMVDELFVTLAPKLQGGSRLPTLIEGIGFPPRALPVLDLLSLYGEGSEVYLRYRLPAFPLSNSSGGVRPLRTDGPSAEPALPPGEG
jgi:riboflavin-specific deaminase-like protein